MNNTWILCTTVFTIDECIVPTSKWALPSPSAFHFHAFNLIFSSLSLTLFYYSKCIIILFFCSLSDRLLFKWYVRYRIQFISSLKSRVCLPCLSSTQFELRFSGFRIFFRRIKNISLSFGLKKHIFVFELKINWVDDINANIISIEIECENQSTGRLCGNCTLRGSRLADVFVFVFPPSLLTVITGKVFIIVIIIIFFILSVFLSVREKTLKRLLNNSKKFVSINLWALIRFHRKICIFLFALNIHINNECTEYG